MKKVITLVAACILVLSSMNAQTIISSWGWEPGTTVGPNGGTYQVYNGTGSSQTNMTDGLNARTGQGYGKIYVPSVPPNAWDNQLVWEGLTIQPATPYRFEIWVKATGTAPAANFTCGNYNYGDVSGVTQKYGTPIGTTWQRVNLMVWLDAPTVAALPLNNGVADQIRFPMHFGVATGTYYLDDYSFTQSAIAFADVVDNKITINFGWDIDEATTLNPSAFGVTVGGSSVAITSGIMLNIGTADAPSWEVELTLARNVLKGEVVKLSCNGPNSGLEYSNATSPVTDNFLVLSFNETINNFSTQTTGLDAVRSESLKFVSDKNTLIVQADNVQALKVYNLSGKCVVESYMNKEVNISDLPAGAYIIKATLNNSVQTGKFIK